jgi:hypothetical protein
MRIVNLWLMPLVLSGIFFVSQGGASALEVGSFLDFEAGGAGSPVTSDLLESCTHGKIGKWVIKTDNGAKLVDSTPLLTISTNASHPLPAPVKVGGTTFHIMGTRGLKSAFDANNNAELDLYAKYPALSAGMYFKTTGGSAWTTHDLGGFWDTIHGLYCYLQMYTGQTNGAGTEIHYHAPSAAVTGARIFISENHWYWITWNFAGAGSRGQLNVYDAEGGYRLVGVSFLDVAGRGTPSLADQFWIGATKYCSAADAGKYCCFDNIVFSLTGEFPLLPGPVQTPGAFSPATNRAASSNL